MPLADRFIALSPERRAAAFAQTAARMAVSPALVEKDFWVCWLLGVLFGDPEFSPHFVFKGGTSLSKVYGVIERFSEDIDLSMSPVFAGSDEDRVGKGESRTKRDKAIETRSFARAWSPGRDLHSRAHGLATVTRSQVALGCCRRRPGSTTSKETMTG